MKPTVLHGNGVGIADIAATVAAMLLLWAGCALALWWAYDMNAFVAGGRYGRTDAVMSVVKFGFILCALSVIVWLRRRKRLIGVRSWRLAWTVWWQTAVILFLYALIVVTRREMWRPEQGMNEWAMFFGSLNGRFFSEVGSLSFVMFATPCIASLSSALFLLLARFRATALPTTA